MFSSNCVLDRWAYGGFRQFCKSSSCKLHWDNCLLTMSSGREAFSFLFESLHWISPVLMDKLLLVEFSTITQWRELSRIFLEKKSPTAFLLTWCTLWFYWSLQPVHSLAGYAPILVNYALWCTCTSAFKPLGSSFWEFFTCEKACRSVHYPTLAWGGFTWGSWSKKCEVQNIPLWILFSHSIKIGPKFEDWFLKLRIKIFSWVTNVNIWQDSDAPLALLPDFIFWDWTLV